jgi:hypothetical protein
MTAVKSFSLVIFRFSPLCDGFVEAVAAEIEEAL